MSIERIKCLFKGGHRARRIESDNTVQIWRQRGLGTALSMLTLVGGVASVGATENLRGMDPEVIAEGRELYQKNCAVCHGENAEGRENWHEADASGKYPPPPLNGSGHAWHHSADAMAHTIRNGTIARGGSMPAWEDTLTEQQTQAIIHWLTTLWPDEIYEAWKQQQHSHSH